MLRSGPVPEASRKEFEAELARNQDREGFRHALKSERAYGLELIETQINPTGGWFGRATVTTKKRLETVILLTPRILTPPESD